MDDDWSKPRKVRGLVLATMSKHICALGGTSDVVVEPDDVDISSTKWGPNDPRWHLHANSAYLLTPTRTRYGHQDPKFSPYLECHLAPLGDAQLAWGDKSSQAILAVGIGEVLIQPVFEAEEQTAGTGASVQQDESPATENEPPNASHPTGDAPTSSPPSQERFAALGLVVLILATVTLAALLNALVGSSQLAFVVCIAFFGLGLRYGDKFLPRR